MSSSPAAAGTKRRRAARDADASEASNASDGRPASEESGEDLMDENMFDDYKDLGVLDQYDPALLDDRAYDAMDHDARRAAEAVMADRDVREGRGRGRFAAVMESDGEEESIEGFRARQRRRRELEEQDAEGGVEAEETKEEPFSLESFSVPLREWVANDRTRSEVKRRFKRFLETFTLANGERIHERIIDEMAASNGSSLHISYLHLVHATPVLAIWLADVPRPMLEMFDEVARDVVLARFPDYFMITDEICVRITNMPIIDSLRELRQLHLNALVKVEGVVMRRSAIFPQMKVVQYNCGRCGSLVPPMTVTDHEEPKPSMCVECQSSGPFILNTEQTVYRNFQRVTLQESPGKVPAGRVPRQKDVILLGDLIDRARPGEEVAITGIYTHTFDAALNTRQGFPVFNTVLEANYVERRGEGRTELSITDEDRADIDALAKDPKIVQRIVRSIAPSIYGHEHVKLGLALAMFGGQEKNVNQKHRIRGDINVLLLGDPGTAKSQFLKYVEKTAPRAVYTTGKGASAVGLTAAVHKDVATGEWMLEGGALVLADRGVCCLAEHDHEILTNRGFLSLHDLERAWGDARAPPTDASLLIAGYDEHTQQLVYERPARLIINARAERQMMVDFTPVGERAAWGRECAAPVDSARVVVRCSDVSLLVTPNHDMYVRGVDAGSTRTRAFRKVKAGALAGDCAPSAVRMLSRAAGGLANPTCTRERSLPHALGWHSDEQLHALASVYGAALRCASDAFARDGCITFELPSMRAASWLRAQLAALHAAGAHTADASCTVVVTDARIARALDYRRARDAANMALASWVWSLTTQHARAVFAGCLRASSDGTCVRTSHRGLCDDVLRLALHAGYAANVTRSGCGSGAACEWRITLAQSMQHAEPVLRTATDVTPVAYTGRTWCVRMPSSFIIARRTQHDPASGALTHASRPLIIGNCIDEFDKMSDQDRTSIHEAMEQQSISISKAGIVTSLQARCAVLAAANPIGGRYDIAKTFSENVQLTDPILTRFDILCVVRDEVDPALDERLATFVVDSHSRGHPSVARSRDVAMEAGMSTAKLREEEAKASGEMLTPATSELPLISQTLLRKYINEAKLIKPQLTGIDQDKIARLYADMRRESEISAGIPIAVRHIESIIRMSEAASRMRMSGFVSDADVNLAIKVMLDSFISAQKFSVMRALRRQFSRYLDVGLDYSQLLLVKLRELVRDRQAVEFIRSGRADFALEDVEVLELRVADLQERARRHGIPDAEVSAFLSSDMLKNSGFIFAPERRVIIRNF